MAARAFPDIRLVRCDRRSEKLIVDRPGTVGWGGNSGFHALNLAVQFGARKIILVGFDMHLQAGHHWHGKHPQGLNNPTDRNVGRWRRTFDAAAPQLETLGAAVVNTSPISALSNYPKMSLEDALECLI